MSKTEDKKTGLIDWLINHSKRILVIVVTLALLASGGLVGFVLYEKSTVDPNILATVGNEKITKADFNERIYALYFEGTPANPTTKVTDEDKKTYLNELIDYKVSEIVAKRMGITVTDEEVTARAKEKTRGHFDTQTNVQKSITKKLQRYTLIEEKLKEKVSGWREGSYVMINFTKNLASNMNSSPEKRKAEDVGREQRIKEDADYAKTLIDSIYADISSGKITFEQGMERAKNDPRFGVEGYKPNSTLQSDSFTKEIFMSHQKIFGNPDITKNVSNTQVGKVSKPFVIQVPVSDSEPVIKKDGMWLIAKVDKGGDSIADSFDEWFTQKKKELKVKVLDKKLAISTETNCNSLIGQAEAHSGSHACNQTDHYGVNTGLSSSSAGLVVVTAYEDAAGVNHGVNRNVTVQGTGGGILWTPNGAWDASAGELNRTWSTGGTFTGTGLSCAGTGWLVLGWGSTSGSGAYGHFGNKNSLSCDHNPFTVWTDSSGYGNYGGKWWVKLTGSANNANDHNWIDRGGNGHGTDWFNVANGWTVWINFTYVVAPQPVCNGISMREGSATGSVIPNGSTVTGGPEGKTVCKGWSTSGSYGYTKLEVFRKDGSSQIFTASDSLGAPSSQAANNNWDWCNSYPNITSTKSFKYQITPYNWANVAGNTCAVTYTVNPPNTVSNDCPTLTASPTTVNQGDPVKLSWSGGANVQSFDIKQQPSGGTLATLYSNAQQVTSGSIDVMPSLTTTYFLDVLYNGAASKVSCPADGVKVNVRPSQSGSDRPVPPN